MSQEPYSLREGTAETANGTCVNHRDRPGTHRCVACDKVLCAECARNSADGVFCSTACADKVATFAAGHKAVEKEFFARANSREKQRGSAHGPPAPRTRWAAVALAFLLGGGVVAYLCNPGIVHGLLEKAAGAIGLAAAKPKPAATQSGEVPDDGTGEASASRARPGWAEGATQDLPLVGARVPFGKLAIELEDYWLEPDPPTDTAYAALSGYLVNNSATALTLPQVDVTLLDGRQREYKSCKSKVAANVTLNPLVKVRGQWAFQVPAKMPMWCAQFTLKAGKDTKTICIGLNKRTPENTELVEADDYLATADELKAFASPRYLLQQREDKELAKMGPVVTDLEAAQKRLARAERQRKTAETAVTAAKAAADKRADDKKDAEAILKDLDANRPQFIHDEPRWQRQVGEARQRLDRATGYVASALKTAQEKTALRDKAANQEREEKRQFDMLKSKFDAQRKVLEDLEKKMAE